MAFQQGHVHVKNKQTSTSMLFQAERPPVQRCEEDHLWCDGVKARRPGSWNRNNKGESGHRSGQRAKERAHMGPMGSGKDYVLSLDVAVRDDEQRRPETRKWATGLFTDPFISFCLSYFFSSFKELGTLIILPFSLHSHPLCRWGKMWSKLRTLMKDRK